MHPGTLTSSTSEGGRAAWAKNVTRIDYLPQKVSIESRDGTLYVRSNYPLNPPARRTGDWLHRWADQIPEAIAVLERDEDRVAWRSLTYSELLAQVRRLATALVQRGLGQTDSIAVISGNSIDHLVLLLAAQYAGIPVTSLAEQYGLVPAARDRLTHIIGRLKPKLVFAEDATLYHDALQDPVFAGCEITSSRAMADDGITPFQGLCNVEPTAELDTRFAGVGPDTVAKILFTSGSSGDPKGVIQTHEMLCANAEQFGSMLPSLDQKRVEIVDWLPWNHVFGGNSNVNMVLRTGGTLTIDNGKPTQSLIGETLRNRKERPANVWFDVPVGFQMVMDAADEDAELREALFANLDVILYAGASLPAKLWQRLEQASLDIRGHLPLMISSWGMTETAPSCLMVHEPIGTSGVIGVPVPGLTLKLVPVEQYRYEMRVKGPNVTPGYFQDEQRTSEAFDDEGYLVTGDAAKFVDESAPEKGLVFDGRISEDFKLLTGTWVQAGVLRLHALAALGRLAQDVVICGHDRNEIGIIVFPAAGAVRLTKRSEGALIDPALQAEVAERLRDLNQASGGSARQIRRAIVAADPPSVEAREVTDKGSLNVNNIIRNRAKLVDCLYSNGDPAVIRP